MEMAWTNKRLFEQIVETLKESGSLPDILDYHLASYDERKITTYEVDCVGRLSRGGSEGIYVDVYLEGEETIKLGTFKTLGDDREAWTIMGRLMADFQWECDRFINKHINEFEGVE